jgi:probable phosphoglycerate mutase
MEADRCPGTVTLVRHAETAWSLVGRHTGRTDLPLTDGGRASAVTLADRLRGAAFASVWTSPLQRATETATLAGFGDALPDHDLLEWHYGEHEGLTAAEIRGARGEDWLLWRDGATGGETADDVGERVDRVIARAIDVKGDVLIFAHGDLLRVLAARWLEQPASLGARLVLGVGGLSVLGHDHGVRALLRWNAVM